MSGGYFAVYDPSSVAESLGFYFLVFLAVAVAIAFSLVRRGASRLGWGLLAYSGANLVFGAAAYLSTMPCGFC